MSEDPCRVREKSFSTVFLSSIIEYVPTHPYALLNISFLIHMLFLHVHINQSLILLLQLSLPRLTLVLLTLRKPLPLMCLSYIIFHLFVSSTIPVRIYIQLSSIWLVWYFSMCLTLWCSSYVPSPYASLAYGVCAPFHPSQDMRPTTSLCSSVHHSSNDNGIGLRQRIKGLQLHIYLYEFHNFCKSRDLVNSYIYTCTCG